MADPDAQPAAGIPRRDMPAEPAAAATTLLAGEAPSTEFGGAAPAAGPSLKQRAVRSGAWQLGGYAVQNVARFASNVILTRLVTREMLGLSAVASVVLIGLEMFSDVGIGPSIVQNKKGQEERFLRTAFTVQVLRGCLLFLVGCAIAWPIATYVTGHPVHVYLIPLAAAVALIEGFRSTGWYRLQRAVRMRAISLMQAAFTLLGITIMVTWAWLSPSVWALVVPMVVVAGLQVSLTHFLLRDRHDSFGWDPESARALFGFGGWVFVSTALTFLANSADRLLFAGMVSMEQLGVYNIAFVLATMPNQALLRLGSGVVFPAYASVRDDPHRFADIFRRVRSPLTLLGGFAAAGLIGAGRPLVDVIYPETFGDAGWMLQILGVAGWLQVLQTSNDAALLATGRPKWVAVGHFCKAVALFSGILLGWRIPGWMGWNIPPFGGAIAGVAVAELVRYGVSAHMMHRLGLHVIRRDAALSSWVLATAAIGILSSRAFFTSEWLDLLVAGGLISLLWLPSGLRAVRELRGGGARPR